MDDPKTGLFEAFFPGKSCFPLSPDKKVKKDGLKKFAFGEKDQMQVIIDVLGYPSADDLAFISDGMAFKYLEKFKSDKYTGPINF